MQVSLQDAFTLYDTDSDGFIDQKSFGSLLRSLGYPLSDSEISTHLSRLDSSSSNKIALPEIAKLVATLASPPTPQVLEKQLLDAFRVFDKDRTGLIGTVELRHLMTSLGERMTEEEADLMIREADPNGEGVVNYAEFIKRMLW